MPRKEGMLRKDLLTANAKIFSTQGKALDQYAKKSVKVRENRGRREEGGGGGGGRRRKVESAGMRCSAGVLSQDTYCGWLCSEVMG